MRNLTNSLAAGQFAALLAAELIFLLNPEVPRTWRSVLSVWGVSASTYGLVCGLVSFVLLFLVETLRGRRLAPAWLSFRVLSWLLMLFLVVAAVLLWHNLVSLRLYLPPETLRALAMSATVVSTAAGAFLFMTLFHYSFGRRAEVVSYTISAVSLAAAVTLPMMARPLPPDETAIPRMPLQDTPLARRVTFIGIEGASMSYVLRAVSEGKLPNFGRLIESGASGALRTLYPTESLSVWTSVATGKLPRQHGLKGFYRYRFPGVATHFSIRPRGLDFRSLDRLGLIQRSAVTAAQRRTQPFWTILSGFGVEVGLVRFWGTYPADEIRGFVVSEYFHRQVRERFEPPLPGLTFPGDLYDLLSSKVVFPEALDSGGLHRFVDDSVDLEDDDFPWKAELTRALADDLTSQSIGRILREQYHPQVFAVYLFGLDTIGHYFTRYQQPESFGDVSDGEIRKYGRVVEAYYRHLDSIVGEYVQRREENETIVILSGHGMEAPSLARRVIEPFTGNPHLSGFHENAPDGLLILNGAGIAPGVKIQGASVVDITPTLLYLIGLPLGQDMDGTLLTEALAEDLAHNQPVTFISSYKNFLIEPFHSDAPPREGSPLDALPEIVEIPP
jgi:predicted AlkP superfamily phosphohydrolase/phosphomutase